MKLSGEKCELSHNLGVFFNNSLTISQHFDGGRG